MAKEKVLVVGGGFGGVKTALVLADDKRFAVTLLTESDEFRYYPTLYHTATGGKRSSSAVPLKTILADKKIKLVLGNAVTIDRIAKSITTADKQTLPYDTLVLGMGVVTNYFNIPGLEKFSFGIKSNGESLRLKQHVHNTLVNDGKPDNNYLIVGAGPTGIELAGALPKYISHVMTSHGLKDRKIRVSLIEALPRLLPRMPKGVSRGIRKRLTKLGIGIHTGKVVQGESAEDLTVSGKKLKSQTVIWTAGVTNHPFFSANKFVIMPRGKVAVDVYLQTEDNIFIVGDNAHTPYSGLAQTAIRDGHFVAKNLIRRKDGKLMKSYKPKIPTSVIPVGERWAVVVWKDFFFFGLLGWLLRSAADFVAFKDLESWPAAARQWANDFGDETDCPVCDS